MEGMPKTRLRNITFTCLTFIFLLRIMLQIGEISSDLENRLLTVRESHRLPDAIIIGGRKCGTRALLDFLSLHPRIKTAEFETHFFDNNTNFDQGLHWYFSRLPTAQSAHDVIIEKTPSYLVQRKVPRRVHDLLPKVKLIVILRNPVTRAISDYTQVDYVKQSKRKTHGSFSELAFDADGAVNAHYKPIRNSLYHTHLLNWLHYFNLSSFHFVDGDNFIVNPIHELRLVEKFLQLDHGIDAEWLFLNRTKGFYCFLRPPENVPQCLGDTKGRPHVKVSLNTRIKLKRYFEPYNFQLFSYINRSFNW